jgi:predicted Zn-dependent peptidase
MMFNKTVLDNGLTLISEKIDHFRSISLGIWVKVGSRDEREHENGISHFIEHMIFKGTRTRNNLQISKELDNIGGLSNAFTGKEYTCFHSKVLDRHFEKLADILSDIFLNSVFDLQDLNRERQVIFQEIVMVEDTPDDLIHVLFNRHFWENHPLGMSVLGTNETVMSIQRETILEYIKEHYTPNRILIAAAGNIEHETFVNCLRPLFEPLEFKGPRNNHQPPDIKSSVFCHYKDLEQAHICLGGKGPHYSSEDRYACAVLNTILGGNMSSRLFQEVREKRGLAYTIFSFLSSYLDSGLFGIYTATDPQDVNQVLQVINKEIREIQRGNITGVDLDDAKEHLIGGMLLGAENTDTRMMRLARNEYIFGRYLTDDEIINRLEKVTIDEVVQASSDVFFDDHVSLVTLGKIREGDLDLSGLRFAEN